MPFEVFDKRMTPLAKAPSVTIQRKGIISINRAAYALIGSPKAVELLYDKDRHIVGLRASDDSVPHAYEVRAQSSAKETGPLIVAGTAFTSFYGIDTTTSKRWTPYMEADVLCIDLSSKGVEIVGNRTAKSSEGVEGDAGE